MSVSIGLVIPAYKPNIEQMSAYIYSLQEEFEDIHMRVELDSPETTVSDRLRDLPVTVNRVSRRRGKGAAITAGFEQLETDVLAFVDADGATPPPAAKSVIDTVVTGTADVAVGSRRHPDSRVHTHQTTTRRYLGDAFAMFARSLLDDNLYDYQCGMKAVSAIGWDNIRSHLHEPGFAWDIEFVTIAGVHNLRIEEVPIDWYDRPGSTVDPLRTSLDLFRAVVSTRHRVNQLQGNRFHTTISRIIGDSPTLVNEQ